MSPNKNNQPHAGCSPLRATIFPGSTPGGSRTLDGRGLLMVLMVGALVTVGCNDSKEIAPVHGNVTIDGAPLSEGFVFVTPAEGRTAKGEIQSDGSFVLGTYTDSDGAKIGTHPVTVLPPPAIEGAPPSDAAKSIPQRYTKASASGISVDVKPNADNELLIELTTE